MSQFKSFTEFFKELCKEEQYPPPRVIQPWLDKKPKYLVNQSTHMVDFLFQEVGTVSEIRKVAVFNLGYKPLRVREVITTGPFIASVSGSAKEISQNGMLTISVRFLPQQAGTHTGRVYVRFHNDEGTFVDLTLRGTTTGEAPPPDPDPDPQNIGYVAALGMHISTTNEYSRVEGVAPTHEESVSLGAVYTSSYYGPLTSPVHCSNGYKDMDDVRVTFPVLFVGDEDRTIEEIGADTWELVVTPPWPAQPNEAKPTLFKNGWDNTQITLNSYIPSASPQTLGMPAGCISLRIAVPGSSTSTHKFELKSSNGKVIELTYNPLYVGEEDTDPLVVHAIGTRSGNIFSGIKNRTPDYITDLSNEYRNAEALYFKNIAKPVVTYNSYDPSGDPSAVAPILIVGNREMSQIANEAVNWTLSINPPWPPNHASIEPSLTVYPWENAQALFSMYFPNQTLDDLGIVPGSSAFMLFLPGGYEEGHTVKLISSTGESVEILFNPEPATP